MTGQQLNGYQITASLGEGGMGSVFRATDETLGREVAIKMLHANLTREPLFLERFKKEARVLARLLHPNIAVIYNFIEQQGNYFMVMEYVEGNNLDNLLKTSRTLPLGLVVPVFIQALEGLQHAHKKDILHRDIKPSNMMLTRDGILKLMDFGIAKIANEQKITQVNKIIGTIEFMAPELIEGKEASVASDIYAMGVALYEVVAGKLPFESDTDYNLMHNILQKKPLAPDHINSTLPRPVSDIIMKSIEKKPGHRYPDARAFQKALQDAFPAYRETDLSLLQAAGTFAGQINAADRLTQLEQNAVETRLESVPIAASGATTFVRKMVSAPRLPFIIGGAGLLAFALFVFSIVIQKNKNESPVLIESAGKTSQLTPLVKDTIPAKVVSGLVNAEPLPENNPTEAEVIPLNKVSPPPKKKTAANEQPVKKSGSSSPETPVIKKDAEKPVEKKEIIINSKVSVELYLRDDIVTAGGDREQNITFTVASPVIYNGLTIIRQGAIATGSIKIGRVITAIKINSVVAANGQTLKFKPDRIHRKKNDLARDRNYSVILEKGITMNF